MTSGMKGRTIPPADSNDACEEKMRAGPLLARLRFRYGAWLRIIFIVIRARSRRAMAFLADSLMNQVLPIINFIAISARVKRAMLYC